MKTTNELYRIREEGAGLDMTHLTYCPKDDFLKDFKYLHTTVRSSNDQIVSDVLEDLSGKILVTEIEFTDKISTGLLSHLVSIGREWVDILEIPASCNWNEDTVKQLKYLLDTGMIYDISIKNPETPDRLNEILNLLEVEDIEVDYVSLDICPINFNYDLIKEIKEKELDIIGYNPMGGYFSAPITIDCFTAPYLLSFAATYCSVVFMSGRDLYQATENARYVKELHGKETESMFMLRKNVHKLVKPLKKVVYTSIVLDDEVHLPYNTPGFVPTGDDSIILNLGKEHVLTKEDSDKLGDLEKDILSFIGNISYPDDSEDLDKFSIARNQIIGYLKTKFADHLFFYSVINDTTVAIKAQKETVEGWFKKTTKTDNHEFIISMMPGGRIYFREVGKMEVQVN